MFSPTDKIVVGVSGGKDSLCLLYNVKTLQDRNPNGPIVEAILIDEGISGYRSESKNIAIEYCKKLNIPLHILSFKSNFGKDLDEVVADLKEININACTICGTVRRRLLNDKALELQANKLAIGHNLDDQSQTFLANILRNDIRKIELSPPQGNVSDKERNFVPRIKPLLEIPEREITLYCFYKKIPIQTTPCPYIEGFSILRKKVQDFLNQIEKKSPEIKYNLLNANQTLNKRLCNRKIQMENEKKNSSEKIKKLHTYNYCSICRKPCGHKRSICYYCELKEKLNIS